MRSKRKPIHFHWLTALLIATAAQAAVIPVTEDIAAGTTETWTAENTYVLNTVVYVQTNATLIIEAGTVIQGGTNVANLVSREGIPNAVSALWVTRGGRIQAEGTKEEPIIFTTEGDDVNDPDDVPPTVTGQWGGVVIMGRAPINSANDDEGNVADPKFDLYEGVTSPGPNFEHAFGGNDPDDDSGVMRYVSIRHTGNTFAPAKELNSLSMGGVGRGTTIEYVESYAGSDDGFEFWGGTVNTRYLVSAFIEDDDFDTDQGYSGTNQFWFGIKPPWQGSSDSRGFETDGDLDQDNGGEEPISEWSVYNATLIGRGQAEAGFGGGVAWNPRDEAAPKVYNSVVVGFAEGIRLDNDGLTYFTNGPAGSWNTVWEVGTNGNANAQFLFSDTAFNNTVEEALLGTVSYAADGVLDPRPQAGSPALGDVLPGAPTATDYRGAFSSGGNWADDWTALAALGYLKPAHTVLAPTITTQPEATVNATVGDTVTLLVVASGDEPITYQWIKDGVDLDGVESATLVLNDAQESDSGTYAVKITNAAGTVTSSDSVVTVEVAPSPTLWELISTTPELSTLKLAVETAGLVDTLQDEDALTAFAPNNAAFDALPEGTLDALLADVEQLTAVLTYHVLAGTQLAADLVAGDYVTLNGASVTVTTPEGVVMVNDATVILADELASNGVAHFIDRVLIPSAPEPPVIQPPIIEDGQITLTWSGEGEVETATNINGPWTPTGNNTGSFSEEVGEGNKYFRIRRPQ